MSDDKTMFLDVGSRSGQPGTARRIAYRHIPAPTDAGSAPCHTRAGLLWLSGFNSTMDGTKASAMADWAAQAGLKFTRFDYSGHGQSSGAFEDGTISDWLHETRAILTHVATGPQVLIGSSMGAWLALLIARDPATDVAGLALIAPAWDMTERLMWGPAPREIRDTLLRDGVWHRPSLYCDDNYPITLRLIEDGRRHLLGDGPLDPGCAVRILHSLDDPDVPWQGSAALLEMFAADADARLTLVNGGGHRLSRDEDVVLLQREVGELVGTGNVALTKT